MRSILEEDELVPCFGVESLQNPNLNHLEVLSKSNSLNSSFFEDIETIKDISHLIGNEGMCMVLAEKLNEVIPGFITEVNPVNSYTRKPTVLNKQLALDKIDEFLKTSFKQERYQF
jgi:uncharacterized protein YlzI (FlbEa/FlbD family)